MSFSSSMEEHNFYRDTMPRLNIWCCCDVLTLKVSCDLHTERSVDSNSGLSFCEAAMLTTAYNAFTFLSNVEKCDYLICPIIFGYYMGSVEPPFTWQSYEVRTSNTISPFSSNHVEWIVDVQEVSVYSAYCIFMVYGRNAKCCFQRG